MGTTTAIARTAATMVITTIVVRRGYGEGMRLGSLTKRAPSWTEGMRKIPREQDSVDHFDRCARNPAFRQGCCKALGE